MQAWFVMVSFNSQCPELLNKRHVLRVDMYRRRKNFMICPWLNTEHVGICSGTRVPHVPSIERMERYCFRNGFVSCPIYLEQIGMPDGIQPVPVSDAEIRPGTVPVCAGATGRKKGYAKGAPYQGRRRRSRGSFLSGKTGKKRRGMSRSAVLSDLS